MDELLFSCCNDAQEPRSSQGGGANRLSIFNATRNSVVEGQPSAPTRDEPSFSLNRPSDVSGCTDS